MEDLLYWILFFIVSIVSVSEMILDRAVINITKKIASIMKINVAIILDISHIIINSSMT